MLSPHCSHARGGRQALDRHSGCDLSVPMCFCGKAELLPSSVALGREVCGACRYVSP